MSLCSFPLLPAHTCQVFVCRPGRWDTYTSKNIEKKKGNVRKFFTILFTYIICPPIVDFPASKQNSFTICSWSECLPFFSIQLPLCPPYHSPTHKHTHSPTWPMKTILTFSFSSSPFLGIAATALESFAFGTFSWIGGEGSLPLCLCEGVSPSFPKSELSLWVDFVLFVVWGLGWFCNGVGWVSGLGGLGSEDGCSEVSISSHESTSGWAGASSCVSVDWVWVSGALFWTGGWGGACAGVVLTSCEGDEELEEKEEEPE